MKDVADHLLNASRSEEPRYGGDIHEMISVMDDVVSRADTPARDAESLATVGQMLKASDTQRSYFSEHWLSGLYMPFGEDRGGVCINSKYSLSTL